MAAASSEDVRLKKKFQVVEPDRIKEAKEKIGKLENMKTYLHSSHDQREILNLIDGNSETYWETSSKETTIDFELLDKAHPNEISIAWRNGHYYNYSFEIQLSGGGGQFIPVFKGTSSGSTDKPEKYEFKGFPASDLRIILLGNSRDDRAALSEVFIKEFKGND